VLGKPIGIFAMSWLAVKTNLGALPEGVGWRHIAGVGMLGGVGFTMALFIAELALTTPEKLVVAKMGIMAASLVAGILGFLLLRKAGRVRRTSKPA
jgi:Na+:H+ antiporter, NhaA family